MTIGAGASMINRIFWLSVFLFAVPLFGFIAAEGLIETMQSRLIAVMMRLPTASSLSILDGTPCPVVFDQVSFTPALHTVIYCFCVMRRSSSVLSPCL
jgi:hypothetical protein